MIGRHAAAGRQKRSQRVRETSEYVAMLQRMLEAWGDRVSADPAALVHLAALGRTLCDATNRGIFEANKGSGRYSQNEIAAILGLTRQAVAYRIKIGERAYARRLAAGGQPMVRLADVRASRAAGLRRAGVADVTGSPRERAAG
jgi:hypothetical protein